VQCPECSHTIPRGSAKCIYCGAKLKQNNEASAPLQEQVRKKGPEKVPDPEPASWSRAEDVVLGFSLKPSKRREPMSRVVLLLIFLASSVFGGFIVWLLR